MNRFFEVATEAAREAGAVLLAEHSRPQKISYKGDVDLVTETDKRSESLIVGRLRREFPDHRIVAEEGSAGAAGASRYEWHVDPLDGTTNFAHGYPCFAVSIGLLEDGKPLLGVVFNPVADEFFSAFRGEGAFLNGKPIRVSGIEKMETSLVATGFPAHKRGDVGNIHYYWHFTLRSHGVRRDGSAALDLCAVACGRFEAFWEFGLKSWDTAAGILIAGEAGGRVTNLGGGSYAPGDPDILVTNGHVHDEIQRTAAEIGDKVAKL
ncbi:MAG: inositol monophosphatase family protein [Candidatus Acidiferrales bacterium]